MGGTRLTTRRCRMRLRGYARSCCCLKRNGDRAGVEAWFAKYDVMPPSLTKALEATKGIPVDIAPHFELLQGVRP